MTNVAVASCHDKRNSVRIFQALTAGHALSNMGLGAGAIDKPGLDTSTSPYETIPAVRSDAE